MIASTTPETPPTTTQPVFLVGCPRSGTTLLQRLLDAHSAIAIAPETHFVRRFWKQRRKYGSLSQDASFQRVLEDIVSMPEFSDMQLSRSDFVERAHKTDRSYGALFDLLLSSFARQRGATVVGEKTPNHLLYIPTLSRFFPSARFLHIVRDPRAVVASWKNVPWSSGTVAGDALVWRRYIRTALEPSRRPAALHTVSYEELTRDTERVLRGICDFLTVPFQPAMLAYHQQDAETLDFDREPWKRGVEGAVHRDSVEHWRQALGPDDIAEIEALVWREMRKLGYQLETPVRSLAAARARRLVRAILPRTNAARP